MSPTEPDKATDEAEEHEAGAAHDADRPATTDEEAAAERALHDPDLTGDLEEVGEHYREMTERGVKSKGEGRI
jgi:hypothetical protein